MPHSQYNTQSIFAFSALVECFGNIAKSHISLMKEKKRVVEGKYAEKKWAEKMNAKRTTERRRAWI